jgi:hypothetical protein
MRMIGCCLSLRHPTAFPAIKPPDRSEFRALHVLAFAGRVGAWARSFSVLLDRPRCGSLAAAATSMACDTPDSPAGAGERNLPSHFRRLSLLR